MLCLAYVLLKKQSETKYTTIKYYLRKNGNVYLPSLYHLTQFSMGSTVYRQPTVVAIRKG